MVVAAGAAVALILAACGGDEPDTAQPAPTDAAPAEEGAPAPTGFMALVGSNYDEIVALAADEPSLVMCALFVDEERDILFGRFAEDFPDLEPVQAYECSGVEPRERVMTEWASNINQTDLIMPGVDQLDEIVGDELMGFVEWSVFDGSPLEVRDQFRDDIYGGYVVNVGSTIGVIAYNSDLIDVEDVPASYWDCGDNPGWEGRWMMDVRPATGNTFYSHWGEDRFREWGANIAAMQPRWIRGDTSSLQQVAQGEAAYICDVRLHNVERVMAADEGGPLNYIWPEEVPFTPGFQIAVGPEPNAPNSAILLTAWLASDSGQAALEEVMPARLAADVPGTYTNRLLTESGATPVPSGWDFFHYDAIATDILLEQWGFPTPEE